MHPNSVPATRILATLFVCSLSAFAFAELTPEAASRFDRYVEAAEAGITRDIEGGRFVESMSAVEKAKLRGGEVSIQPGAPPNVPGAMIQDWRGDMFMPQTTIQDVKAVLQDYDHYKEFYKPEVIESKQIAHQGDEFDVLLRMRKKQVLSVVLNSAYHVRYSQPDPRRMHVTSRSTRIAEVKDSDRGFTEEEPAGRGFGFLWRLNSYWRFEEADGGVYAECRAISLSRDVPLGLGWMIKGFISKFPKESMQNTLRGTKAAVESRSRL